QGRGEKRPLPPAPLPPRNAGGRRPATLAVDTRCPRMLLNYPCWTASVRDEPSGGRPRRGRQRGMNHFLHGVARAVAGAFSLPDPVPETAPFRGPGQDPMGPPPPPFAGPEFPAIAPRPGPGVDQVADVQALPFPDASAGTVIAMSTFEHVPRFWRGFEE